MLVVSGANEVFVGDKGIDELLSKGLCHHFRFLAVVALFVGQDKNVSVAINFFLRPVFSYAFIIFLLLFTILIHVSRVNFHGNVLLNEEAWCQHFATGSRHGSRKHL